ncbi:hypothetical protein TMEN_4178 [Trichophyton mentagrophytes]|nr:hypothetical protein TMEN_4178 [Trichophyton mentagrophytes]
MNVHFQRSPLSALAVTIWARYISLYASDGRVRLHIQDVGSVK